MLCLAVLLSSCGSLPPKIPVCIGDGFGGADCVEVDQTKAYRKPSELKNYWMTDQRSMNDFAAWCYRTDPQTVEVPMTPAEPQENPSEP